MPLPLLLWAILTEVSRLSAMKAFSQLPLLLPTILGYLSSDPTEVALPCLPCLVVVGLVTLVVLVVLVVLVSLVVLVASPLGVRLLGLSLIKLNFFLATRIISLKQGHIYQALKSGPHGYMRHGQSFQWLIQSSSKA